MYIDTSEIVRVRVEADEFYDDEPGPPKAAEGVMQVKAERRRPPYTIIVSFRFHINVRCIINQFASLSATGTIPHTSLCMWCIHFGASVQLRNKV